MTEPRKPSVTFARAATCLALLSAPTVAMMVLVARLQGRKGIDGGREP